jgi:hypothetical protein
VQRAEESIDLKRKQLDSHLGEMEALVTAIELAKVGPTPRSFSSHSPVVPRVLR